MSGIGLFLPLQAIGTGVAIAPILLVMLTGGLVGMSIRNMFDSILFDDEDPASVDASDASQPTGGQGEGMADGGLMAEDDGDFGDFGGLDDGGDGDDAFGDDEFGDMDDASAGTDELEHRLDELENEVGSLSSTVNTVRTENEQISETVEDVEENVRKLLDIYEMVTRGVNPFADDIEAGMGGGGMADDGSFGLFDDGSGGGGGTEDGLDEDIAAADAEGFFDEDLVDDGEDDFDEADFDDGDGMFDDGDAFEEDDFDEEFAEASEDGEGGKSFQELKDEYDNGDAEWAEGEGPSDDEADAEATEELDEDDDLADDELFDEVVEDEGGAQAASTADPEPAPSTADPTAPSTDGATESASTETTTESTGSTGAGKPYLAELPAGFAGDLVVVEWLEFLTERSSYRATDDAIDYYERIDWISPAVADELREYLRGFDSVEGDGGALTIDDHTQSLQYISQLDGGSADSLALSKLVGGGGNGLQR